jgi:membrane protein DedA with SNARE-associated domain
MLHNIVTWIITTVGAWGYPGIMIMMFLESTCFPLPSELVMPPAGYLASAAYRNSPGYVAGHEMNAILAIVAGTVGSCLGALFNYYLARLLGRPLLLKYGKYFLVSEKHFNKGERFFQTHGEISTFTGRLVLGVRHFISLPAGVAHMALDRFILWTALGSAIWCTILTVIGYVLGENWRAIEHYKIQVSLAVLGFCALIVVGYVWWHRRRTAAGGRSA